LEPNVPVTAGDLTWEGSAPGSAPGYTELAEWLTKKLFPAAASTAADCVVCPCNHDIDREAAFILTDRTQDAKRADDLVRPERLAEGFVKPLPLPSSSRT